MIHIGINLHFMNMVNSAINDKGEEIWKGKLPATRQSLSDFFNQFEEPVQAVVECTSFWYWVADWCQEHHISLILAYAKMTRAISYAKVKTDKVDTKTLAELLRAGLIPQAHMQLGPSVIFVNSPALGCGWFTEARGFNLRCGILRLNIM